MHRRVLTPWLLVLALATACIAFARGQEPETGVYEEKLTAEEEFEAVQVAERFMTDFEAKNDPTHLIEELFVKDFGARLRNDPNPFIYLAKVEPEVVAKASDEELLRLYAASLNFIYSTSLLYGNTLYNHKLKGMEPGVEEMPLRELLPPGTLSVLKSDPLMAALIAEDEELEKERRPEQIAEDDSQKEERAEGPEIRSLERLRGFSTTLEKASLLLRQHLKNVRGPRGWKELTNALRTLGVKNEGDAGCAEMCPRLRTLEEEFFGSPSGTRLACVNVMAFHMDLIRVDGRLRVLNVYLSGD